MSKVKGKTFKIIGKTVVWTFAVVGLIFIVILLGVFSLMSPKSKLLPVPQNTVLTLNLNTTYAEIRQDDLFAEFTDTSVYSIFDLVRAINVAATDNRVKALQAELNMTSLSLAQVQDISEALAFFKSQGKKAYLFSSSMGSFGQGTKEYALATLFDEIWLQPHADIGMTGVDIEVPFFKNILKKVGVEPEFYTRYEYKTAVASFTDSNFTPFYKEELERLGSGLYNELVQMAAKGRNIEVSEIKKAIDEAPLLTDRAFDLKLIDKIGYAYELRGFLKSTYQAEFYDMTDYMAHISQNDDDHLPEVAFLVLEGVIESGESDENPLNDAVIGSATVLSELEELKKRPNLKALVLRINSPGGSYTASDEIRAALNYLKVEKKIPIVVSMSTYAASGGYFIALAGDYIMADPATITGSIGVLGGKIVFKELMNKLDIHWGDIKFGRNAGILSANHKFSDSEKAVFEKSLDDVYLDFTTKVAEARHIDVKKMNSLARGRIWLGRHALENGLIDELGGLQRSILKAKELSGIGVHDRFVLSYYPRRETLQEKLTKFIESGGDLPIFGSFDGFEELKTLYRLKHNAVLPPMVVKM